MTGHGVNYFIPKIRIHTRGGRIIAGRVIARATIRGSKSNLRRACEGDEVEGRGGEREGEG